MNCLQDYEEGKVLLIDKPLHWSSFDVVRKIRSIIKIKKVGHAGTLDPLATGLLIVCTGKYTKQINKFMSNQKEYTGTITLGAVTTTFDLESEPYDFKNVSDIRDDKIIDTCKQFTGVQNQTPPIYSAIKQKGKPVYLLARKGMEVKMEPRAITIKEFEVLEINLPVIHFRVICSSGTYIRSLANDFGFALGCGGHLSSLCRTKIGEYELADAMSIESFRLNAFAKTDNQYQ